MNFEKLIGRILKAEGGYTNDEHDSGGPTNWGIIQRELAEWRGKPVSIQDMKDLQLSEAILIYKAKYWDKMNLDSITDERIQLVLLDQGVNRGIGTAAKQAQQVANLFGAGLSIDGNLGPVSAGKINGLSVLDFIREFLQASEHAYVNIVIRNPTQIKFLRGWLNRVHNLQDEIFVSKGPAELPKVEKPADVPAEAEKSEHTVPLSAYFGAPWVGANIDLLGRDESDPELNARYVPEWKQEGLPGYKTLMGNDHAWCSVRANADRRKVGIKGTNSAAAASWSAWGKKCDYVFGAALDIRHASGGRHICDFLYWIDEKNRIAATLDGNRGNKFCIARTDLNSDSVVKGPRWPNAWPDGQKLSKEEVLAKYPHLKVGSSGPGTR